MIKKFFFGFFLIGSLFFIFYKALQIKDEPQTLWSDYTTHADCGIVLTGAPGRVREGFELLAQKRIQKLILSGVFKDVKMSELFPYSNFYPEVNLNDIYLEKRSETTFGNARHSLSLVEALKCKDILLMTSQIHMHRSYKVFKTIFPDSILIHKLSLPNARIEKSTEAFGLEIIKNLFYYLLIFAEWLNVFN